MVDNFFMIIQSVFLNRTKLSLANHRRGKFFSILSNRTKQRKTFSGEKYEEKINLIILCARRAYNKSLNKAIAYVFLFQLPCVFCFVLSLCFIPLCYSGALAIY